MTDNVITPYKSMLEFNRKVDSALVLLDEASEDFKHAVLPSDYDELSKLSPNKDDLVRDIKSYCLLTSFLVDHPLINILKDIRDQSQVTLDGTSMLAYTHNIRVGQRYMHYKGTEYTIVAVSKDSDNPVIEMITYKDDQNNFWTLPSHAFSRRVHVDGVVLERFMLVGRGSTNP